MKIKKIHDSLYLIEREGKMRVPLWIYVNEGMLKELEKDRSIEQGVNMSLLPGIVGRAIMLPDAHQGYGFPIGGVGAMDAQEGCISPGGIGYDINCGVRLISTPLTKDEVKKRIKELVDALFRNVPVGVGSTSPLRLSTKELDDVLNLGIKWVIKRGYGEEEDGWCCEEGGSMTTADASSVSSRAKERGRPQLGTLGAGNHFLEVQEIEEIYDKETASAFGITSTDQVLVMVHCGSRGLGHQVCSDYIKRMEEEQPDILKSLVDRELIYAPLGERLARDYFGAMSAAANYGWANRQIITHQIRAAFKEVFGDVKLKLIYDVAHNIAKVEEHTVDDKKVKVYVHRKGATRAFGPGCKEIPEIYREVGQPVIIPGSMGTASYLLVGTERAMKETFGSTPHGAGRVLSRHKALKKYRSEEIRKELSSKGIHLRAGSKKGIAEEAPGVYKDIDEVVKIAHDAGIGDLVVKLKPIGIIKG
jgi:tRNA-splicing ligase RtcB